MTRAPRPRRAGGLTLIEVLVALAIVAVTLAAGMKAAGALVNGSLRLSEVLAAQWCAENQLTELRLQGQFPATGDGRFDCQQAGQDYVGTLVVRATPNPNFRRVDARISDAAGQPLVTLSTVLRRP